MRLPRAALLLALAAGPAAAQTLMKSWDGLATDDNFGRSVAFAGDTNGDGYDDVIVGAPFADPLGLISAGRATIYSGADGSVLRTLNGAQAGERQGWSVAGVGDVNGDGFDDVAVGVPNFNASAAQQQIGAVRVYNGKTGAQLFQRVGPWPEGNYGCSVDGAGDWNGDGTPDVVAGALNFDHPLLPITLDQIGYANVVSGAGPTELASWNGDNIHDNFGASVAGAGDVDGAGEPDIVVGSSGANTAAGGYAGKATVFRGETGLPLFTVNGTQATGSLGRSVDGGDFDGDGFSDIVVGAYFEAGTAGVVHVYKGPGGTIGQAHVGAGPGDFFGNSVACVGDADHDGGEDFAVGAYQTDATDAGYVRVWSGKTSGLLYATIPGQNTEDHFGVSVGGRGDLDANGWPDLLVGADLHNGVGKPDAGRAYAYDLVVHQTNIGFGGPGAAVLDVFGPPLSAGKQATLLLTGASPNKPATLFVSATLQPTFFKGGVLAPGLGGAVMLTLVTNAQGRIQLGGIKGGGGPYDVYVQIVIKDPAQVKGYALSNAVKMHFLP